MLAEARAAVLDQPVGEAAVGPQLDGAGPEPAERHRGAHAQRRWRQRAVRPPLVEIREGPGRVVRVVALGVEVALEDLLEDMSVVYLSQERSECTLGGEIVGSK